MSKNLLLQLACLIVVCHSSQQAFAEIYQCGRNWTNQPCEDGTAPVFNETEQPDTARSRLNRPHENMSPDTGSPNPTLELEEALSIRPRKFDRSDPIVMSTQEFHKSELEREIHLRVRASGRVRLNVVLKWRTRITSKYWHTKKFAAKTVDFEYRDQEKNISMAYRIPPAADEWTWTVVPKYSSKNWKGYHDLTGCCSYHGGVSGGRCQRDGTVMCHDGNQSPTCRCE